INKDYILLAVANANSSTSGHFIPANTCVSHGGSVTGPEGAIGQPAPGTIYNCISPTSSGCGSQTLSSAVLKANFLWIEGEQKFSMQTETVGNSYFMGGIRTQTNLATVNQALNTNSPISWLLGGFFGDNGISD